MKSFMNYDIIVIGAGIVGTAIAYELGKYSINTIVLEKNSDVGMGITKANSGIIHAGYDPKPNTLMAKLNVQGNYLYHRIVKELEIDCKWIGSLLIAFNNREAKIIEKLYKQGVKNGVTGMEIVDKDKMLKIERNVNREAIMALYAKTTGIISPYGAAIAFFENAKINGVKFCFHSEVIELIHDKEIKGVILNNGKKIYAPIVINACGLYADRIAKMVGESDIVIKPRKGEYILFEKNSIDIHHVIFPCPTRMGKGILVSPTVDGNIFVGPTAEDIEDIEDVSVTRNGINKLINMGKKLVPSLNIKKIITQFSGIRAIAGEDFIIRESKNVQGLFHCSGIKSPGLASAPAIAKYVVELLKESERVRFKKNNKFNPYRKKIIHFASLHEDEQRKLLERNPNYGRIVCRCEMVSEGEIVEAVNRGATTLDGIKFRTRAGMGRCQGCFCTPSILRIISRELKIDLTNLRKNEEESWIVIKRQWDVNKDE